jgi:ubiquinone/menaquinone biosynthesis C-methylase UbiE
MVPLEQVAGLLRCPKCGARGFHISSGSLECAACKERLPMGSGCLDLIGGAPERLSRGQRFFFSPLGAKSYALLRERRAAWLLNRKTFREEVEWLTQALELRGDELLLDVPCGQGNFAQALARSLPRGVVIGIDLSMAMLTLARDRLEHASLHNAVLVRGDALDLPLADGAVQALSDCGGLHLYPDVPRAIKEMRRVLAPGGRIAGLTFRKPTSGLGRVAERLGSRLVGARAFDFDALGEEFRRAGFEDYRWEGSALIAWFSARAA